MRLRVRQLGDPRVIPLYPFPFHPFPPIPLFAGSPFRQLPFDDFKRGNDFRRRP
jgi:hypothetical protein